MIFDRLAIGTANFGREYNGVKVSEKEQVKILDYCKKVGINMIDTATAYGWDWTKIDPYFKVVVKTQKTDKETIENLWEHSPYCIMAHSIEVWKEWAQMGWWDFSKEVKRGASIYEPDEFINKDYPVQFPIISNGDVIQCPYSLYDRRFEKIFHALKLSDIEIHVRSVFLRGRILEKALPHDCISFCLMNPYVDRVIIGVDSLEQLKQNMETFVMFDSLRTDDENIIDPRKWSNNGL